MKLRRFEFKALDGGKVVEPEGVEAPISAAPIFVRLAESTEPEIEEQPAPLTSVISIPTYSEEDLLRSRTEGYEGGYAKGFLAARAEDEERQKQILATLKHIAAKVEEAPARLSLIEREEASTVAQLVFTAARVLAGAALDRFASDTILSIVEEAIAAQYLAPELVIKVSDSLLNVMMDKTNELKERVRFAGKIHVIGDARFAPGDCAIEWNGGGLKREWKMLEEQVMQRLGK